MKIYKECSDCKYHKCTIYCKIKRCNGKCTLHNRKSNCYDRKKCKDYIKDGFFYGY